MVTQIMKTPVYPQCRQFKACYFSKSLACYEVWKYAV